MNGRRAQPRKSRVAIVRRGRERSRLLPLASAVVALALPLAGCSKRVSEETGRAALTSIVIAVDGGAATEETNDADDEAIARDLREALRADDTLSPRAREVGVSVSARRITLRGRVANVREHDDVIAKARLLGGDAIVDQMTVAR